MVTQNGGEIKVHSDGVNRGTTFEFYFLLDQYEDKSGEFEQTRHFCKEHKAENLLDKIMNLSPMNRDLVQ